LSDAVSATLHSHLISKHETKIKTDIPIMTSMPRILGQFLRQIWKSDILLTWSKL